MADVKNAHMHLDALHLGPVPRSGPLRVAFCDLSHAGQSVASNAMPYGIACVAAYLHKCLDYPTLISIHKLPEEFETDCMKGLPDIIAFSNYLWNLDLAYCFAERIKAASPKTITVFGGPNFPSEDTERRRFLRRYPAIDVHIYKEGERAFLELVVGLLRHNLDVAAFKRQQVHSPGAHYLDNDGILVGSMEPPRIRDLDEIPSPYLAGLLDRFFDGRFVPVIQTNRGCPFQCTFCTEGQRYFNKVYKHTHEYKVHDLRYIAGHAAGMRDLIIADANFAMFADDLPFCRILARLRADTRWPQYLMVSTGKNQKERTLEAARMLEGSLHLLASLQSTDDHVLRAVRRRNISIDELIQVAQVASDIDGNSVCELILGLPGDSAQAHMKSIRMAIDADINTVRLFQFIFLPGTESASCESRKRYGLGSKWRVVPGCFGKYRFQDRGFSSVETEEICVQTQWLSYTDYLECRCFDLTVELMYNYGYFRELHRLMRHWNVSVYESLEYIHTHRQRFPKELKALYERFRACTDAQLYESRDECIAWAKSEAAMAQLLDGSAGGRVLFDHKAMAYVDPVISRQLHEVVFALSKAYLAEHTVLSPSMKAYLLEVEEFSKCRKMSFLDTGMSVERLFHYDFVEIARQGFCVDPELHSKPDGVVIGFRHDPEWARNIEDYKARIGSRHTDLGRVLLRAPVHKLYRNAHHKATTSPDCRFGASVLHRGE